VVIIGTSLLIQMHSFMIASIPLSPSRDYVAMMTLQKANPAQSNGSCYFQQRDNLA
jgi:hypothetical protein